MRNPPIHQVFVNWLETAGSRLAVAVRVRGRSGQRIALSFDGINPAIGAFLTSRELIVSVDWEGRNWDLLVSLDVMPRRSAGGYTCECCKPEGRTVFPNLEALWSDHLFEPFLAWVNRELAAADAIGLYGSPSDGCTQAKLLSEDDLRRAKPGICVSVRVRSSNDDLTSGSE